MTCILRNVRPWGAPAVDVSIADGRIKAIGVGLPRGTEEIDGTGTVLLPGIQDHHLHIMALAARRQSVGLAGFGTVEQVQGALRAAPADFVRAVDYDERVAGLPDAAMLDTWLPDRPLRLADRTGALWVLNSAAMRLVRTRDLPAGAERDPDGRPTGRFWREDQWLRTALATPAPDLAGLGAELAALGLTALTDATAHNGPEEAALLAGKLPQRLVLMGSEALGAGRGYDLGALKIMLDERALPILSGCAARIARARQLGRPVAAHCVTDGELAFFLGALDAAGGARPGDRIEHGSLIPPSFDKLIVAAGLTVTMNPAFIHDRGNRYRREIEADQWENLYPAARIVHAGIPLRLGSDAPYGTVDPWAGMRAMRSRLTRSGEPLGPGQRIEGPRVLHLYCHGAITVNSPADLMLCRGTLSDVVADLSAERVCLTIIGGHIVHNSLGR